MRKLERVLGFGRSVLRDLTYRIDHLYRVRSLERAGREPRLIEEPLPPLKEVQRCIKSRLLDTVPMPRGIVGGVKGMSLRDHAGIHAGQPVVVTLDIRRCFPSTNHLRVYKAFQAHFSPSPEIAKLLTRLVTRNYRLPQGAPTSLALSNICLLPLFDQLAAFCEARDLRLSIWCDDIAISGLCAHEFVPTVERIIRVHGHRPNQKKRAIMMNWQEPQLVTGLVVNHGLSRLGDQREAIRAEAIALAKEHQLADNLDRMLGHGSFMTFVSPTQGSRFLRLLERLGAVDTLDRESTG